MADPVTRVLFLCTANSARSQIAEALLQARGAGHYEAGSAGTQPGPRVHPGAVAELAKQGIDWTGHRPKSIDDVRGERWDMVITVCDNAREGCPIFPGQPTTAHWSIDDPAAEAEGSERERAFADVARGLGARIDTLIESGAP